MYSGANLFERGWTLLYSGVAKADLIAPQLEVLMLFFSPVDYRVASMHLGNGFLLSSAPNDISEDPESY